MFLLHEDKRVRFESLARDHALHHAYLFFGDDGVGKKTFALMFAHFLERGTFSLSGGPLLDSSVFSPNEKGIIGIDEIRTLRMFLFQKPFVSQKRIAIIDDAEKLTEEAASALLKIVEEPPSHALIIFIAQNTDLFFPPLLSRFTKEYFRRLSNEDMERVLIDEYGILGEKAKKIAYESFGRLGMALASISGVKKKKEVENAESEIQKLILNLRNKGIVANSSKIFRLLGRLMLVKRYNTNEKLQLKAVQCIIEEKHD